MFADRWRFPIPAETRRILAGIAWESPATDATDVIEKLAPPAGRAAPKKTVAP